MSPFASTSSIASAASSTRPIADPFPSASRMSYLPGLDGVRAIAVTAVLAYHLPGAPWPGGFLGVDVFFVLSGFLITSLLLGEISATGGIRFSRFYVRRARRLLPAVLVLLGVIGLLVPWLAPDASEQFRQDAIAALSYTTNWWYVLDSRSYFEAIGRPPLLQHLWSLAVEEQFYLIWPGLLYLLHRRWGRIGVAIGATSGAVASSVLMIGLFAAGSEQARLYFGSDTHASAVLVGAALAAVYRPSSVPVAIPARAGVTVDAIGVTALTVLMTIVVLLPQDESFLYVGGFFIVALLAAAVVFAAAHPWGRFSAALAVSPLRWIGSRSYGIYLWHWPIFLLMRPELDLPYGGPAASVTAVAVTLFVAEVSFRWVESPFRSGRAGAVLRQTWSTARATSWGRPLTVLATTATILLVAVPLYAAAPPQIRALDGVGEVGAEPLAPTPPVEARGDNTSPKTSPKTSPGPVAPTKAAALRAVTLVGDSVLLGARSEIRSAMPKGVVDAAVSRQPEEVLARVEERRRAGALADKVVIHAGTNGMVYAADLRNYLDRWRGVERIVLVTNRVPRSWQDDANKNLRTAASEYSNVVLADWHATSKSHRDYFTPDGVHLTEEGASAYSALIKRVLAPSY